MVWWSESLTTNHEAPGSIPGSTVGIFLEGEDSRGDHGLGRFLEFRFKAPPGNTSSSITTHRPSGQRNCASWASQPHKVTLLSCPGGRTTKSTKDMWWHWTKKKHFSLSALLPIGQTIYRLLQLLCTHPPLYNIHWLSHHITVYWRWQYGLAIAFVTTLPCTGDGSMVWRLLSYDCSPWWWTSERPKHVAVL